MQPFRDMPAAMLEGHKIGLAVQLLRTGGRIRIRALGTSMLPTIWPGDILHIESTPQNELAVGDVVLVMREKKIVIHRLVSNGGRQWVTRGDAVPQDDPHVADAELLGRVTQIDRGSRSLVPRKRLLSSQRLLAWVLCRWHTCRNVVLRAHALWREPSLHAAEKISFGEGRSQAR